MRKNCRVCGSVNRSSHHRMTCLKGTKFIRIVKKSCATHFRLPARFGRDVGEFLQDGAFLYVQGVDAWRVEVVHSSGSCTFGTGWAKVYERYKVAPGSVLMFKYLGYSGFKVNIFNGRTGLVSDARVPGGSYGDAGEPSAEVPTEVKRVGRPSVSFQVSEEVSHVKLYGMKLWRFTMYNLRAELRRRKLEEDGCKGELIERLGRFIMCHGPDRHYERIRFGAEWRWM